MTLTTPHLLFRIRCSIQCEWEMQPQSYGSFNHCASDFRLIDFGLNSLRSQCRIISYSIVPSEHHSSYIESYTGVQNGLFKLCDMTLCSLYKKCSICEEVRDIFTKKDVIKAMKDGIITIRKASCDNYTSFAKFVKRKPSTARLIQRLAHLSGSFNRIILRVLCTMLKYSFS